ncbi:MAG: universal stress protein, partial [Draconibacterium sp.]|nr:universal stress protein [Draconibacterium sp.]
RVSWQKHLKMELQEAHENAQLKLVEFSDELKKQIPKTLFESVKIHYRMLKGTPQNVISDASERYKPDIILMGVLENIKRSGGFLEKTIVKVIEQSNCPVLAVPGLTTLKVKNKINVMYATNFYEADNSSLNKLLYILQPFEKEIHCVHVSLHKNPHYKEKEVELNELMAKDYGEHNIQCELLESENINKGFNDFVVKNSIDIISFSKMKRSAFYKMFHQSLLQKLISGGAEIPVLIFPV